jgi:hypothetical protein
MSHGPLSTVFLVTAELFPTKWRTTGEREEKRGEETVAIHHLFISHPIPFPH